MKKLLFLSLIVSVSAFSSWEYDGYSGRNNQIEKYGKSKIHEIPYPADFDAISDKEETTCLCDKKTEAELLSVKKQVFRKNSLLANKVKSGDKLVMHSKIPGLPDEIISYGLFFYDADTKLIDSAYDLMRRNISNSQKYAFIKNARGIYFIERDKSIPQRAFLHFIRGLDATISK